MKLAFFNDFTLGIIRDGHVIDVSEAVRDVAHDSPQDLMNEVISDFHRLRPRLDEVANTSIGVSLDQVHLRPPLPRPNKIIAMAVNYMEFGAREEPAPINAFLKSPEAIIGPGDTILIPDIPAPIFHHEAELGVVIGKRAQSIEANNAHDYIFGYVNFIDTSARGLGGGSFYWGKSWDTFAPLGPAIVTADEIPDPQNLSVRLWVNGKLRQEYSTNDMAHEISRCIEWCSMVTTLEPGDVIATGTNHQGLGAIQDHDLIEMEIDGLGKLVVSVKDPLKRQWPRGIDQATANRAAGRTTVGGFGEPVS